MVQTSDVCRAVTNLKEVIDPKFEIDFWMFPKIGGKPPKWMVKIMESPVKMDDLGGKPTIFGNIHVLVGLSVLLKI